MLDSADDDAHGGVVTDLAPVPSARSPRAAVQGVLASLPSRSPDPMVCPFLRRATDHGLVAPGASPDDSHRCGALGAPLVPSLIQQELMCLQSAHAGCPRFRQGTAAIGAGLGLAPSRGRLSGAMQLASVVILVVLIAGIGLVVLGGGLPLGAFGGAGPTGTLVAAASASASASPAATTAPPSPSPSPTATPTFPPSPTPSVAPLPTPNPTPTSGGGGGGGSPWAGLAKCPGGQACYLYHVQTGDTFIGIASKFGTTKAALQALNPQITNPALLFRGELIKVPPPH